MNVNLKFNISQIQIDFKNFIHVCRCGFALIIFCDDLVSTELAEKDKLFLPFKVRKISVEDGAD